MTFITDRKHWGKPTLSSLSIEETLQGTIIQFDECTPVSGQQGGEGATERGGTPDGDACS